jgi:uncharacterized protein (TIGR03382 family)
VSAGVNFVGHSLAGTGNVIGHNGRHGIFIESVGSIVQANYIGTNPAAQDLGNASDGIRIENGFGVSNTIGADSSLSVPSSILEVANTIAHNAGAGIRVLDLLGVSMIGNFVRDNAGPGIDLGPAGFTPNDPGDPDVGPNNLQNYPEVDAASFDLQTGDVVVTYRIDTDPAEGPFRVDFYVADAGLEEGASWIGTNLYALGGAAQEARFTPIAGVPVDDTTALVLAATTDGALHNTSEFSPPVFLPEPGTPIALAVGTVLLAGLGRRRRARDGADVPRLRATCQNT